MAPNVVCLQKMLHNFAEKHMKTLFMEVTPKNGFHDLCGGKSVWKIRTLSFRASLWKIGQKSFAPQKFARSCTCAPCGFGTTRQR